MANLGFYETLFVVDMSLGEETVHATVEKFKSMIEEIGSIREFNEWGKRTLAYPIDYKTEGYYVLATYEAPHDFPAEFDRVLKLNEAILRFMTTVAVAKAAAPEKQEATEETQAPAEA